MNILLFLLIGAAAGWIAGELMRGHGFGVLGNIIVGMVGALIGGMLFGAMGYPSTSIVGELVTSTIGAVILLFAISFVRRETGTGSSLDRI